MDALKCAIAVRSSYGIDIEESTFKKFLALILVPNPWYMYSTMHCYCSYNNTETEKVVNVLGSFKSQLCVCPSCSTR